ncbi:MAG TPA: hypothetical protein VMS84_07990 [Mycobacterium sp.]|jgi:hypothetical protein|nr:hypothetical protein [Mycobacterium sp.]
MTERLDGCFVCHKAAKWRMHQAGVKDSELAACRLHVDKALMALLDTGEPPTPVAGVFAIVEKCPRVDTVGPQ